MAILSIMVFGAALFASTYAIWTTVSPELARIGDLLVNGPVATPVMASMSARSPLRTIRVREAAVASWSPQRAVA